MRPAFPASNYYGGSVPPRRLQTTAILPSPDLAGQRGGQRRSGSHVHHAPVGGGGVQLFPCSLTTGTPQSFPVVLGDRATSGLRVARCGPRLGRPLLPGPYRPGWSRYARLRGFHHWFTSRYTFPPCLPDLDYLAVLAHSVVVEAARAQPCASRVRLPPASTTCCDRPRVGLCIPPGCVAPRGARWRRTRHRGTRHRRVGGRERRAAPRRARRRCG
jgi:hypothetical protein